MNLKINESFNRLLGKLSDEELRELEASILEEGVRDPIVTWQGTIIDGYNRYRIATKHGLTFVVEEMEFETELHALQWIISNHFKPRSHMHRFLSEERRSYLRGKQYRVEEELYRHEKFVPLPNSTPLDNIRFAMRHVSRLAVEHDSYWYRISEFNILNDIKFSYGVDAIAMDNPEEVQRIFECESKLSRNQVQNIGGAFMEKNGVSIPFSFWKNCCVHNQKSW